jgi:hypothetical protein
MSRNKIHAIETEYAGCRFRSRLEARWAVFFDRLNIRWQYEPEGFETPDGRYLPDFYLPERERWIEIKGGSFTRRDKLRAGHVATELWRRGQGFRVHIGDIPRPGTPIFPCLVWGAGWIVAEEGMADRVARGGPLAGVAIGDDTYREVEDFDWMRGGWPPGSGQAEIDVALTAARSARFGTWHGRRPHLVRNPTPASPRPGRRPHRARHPR